MGTRRADVAAAGVGGCLYAVGGFDGPQAHGHVTAERYDPRTDTWENIPSMTFRRRGLAVVAVVR